MSEASHMGTLESFLNQFFEGYGKLSIVKRADGFHLFQAPASDAGKAVHVLALPPPEMLMRNQTGEYLESVTDKIREALRAGTPPQWVPTSKYLDSNSKP